MYWVNVLSNRRIWAMIVPIFVLLLPMFHTLTDEWQKPISELSLGEVGPRSQTESVVRNLIEANQILRLSSNSSTYVATGSVADVACKLGEDGGIRTYANVSLALLVKGSLDPNGTVTIWYEGGEFGEWGLVIHRLYPHYPGDTVALPSVFELKVGMNILFFAFQQPDDIELLLYVLVPSEYLQPLIPHDSSC